MVGDTGFAARPSSSVTREANASIVPALLSALAAGAAVWAGHPIAQIPAITSAAVIAPVIAAASEGEIESIDGQENGQENGHANRLAPLAPDAPSEGVVTSEASRSMVGGARFGRPESGIGAGSSGLLSSMRFPLKLEPAL
jgi:hypothetical protein